MCILIYVSILLPIFTQYIWTGCRRCFRAIQRGPENDDWVNSNIYSEAVIMWGWRSTYRKYCSIFRDILGGHDQMNLKMHSEIVIDWVWWFSWRPSECKLGGRNRASVEIHLEAVINRVWRQTWRPRSSKIGRELGCDWWKVRWVLRLYSSVS